MSAYRVAIDLTIRTVERRARYFRNLIAAGVLVGLVSIACALIARSPAPLMGIVLVVPVSGIFFFADAKVLDTWRAELLRSWAARDIDIAAFSAAVRANPALPRGTIEGMLATLPSAGNLVEEQGMATATRHAIATTTLRRYRSASDAVGLKAAASALAAGALLAAALR